MWNRFAEMAVDETIVFPTSGITGDLLRADIRMRVVCLKRTGQDRIGEHKPHQFRLPACTGLGKDRLHL